MLKFPIINHVLPEHFDAFSTKQHPRLLRCTLHLFRRLWCILYSVSRRPGVQHEVLVGYKGSIKNPNSTKASVIFTIRIHIYIYAHIHAMTYFIIIKNYGHENMYIILNQRPFYCAQLQHHTELLKCAFWQTQTNQQTQSPFQHNA